MVKLLKQKYFNEKFVKIYNADILKFNIEKLNVKFNYYGNLPYNISSQILVKIIKFRKMAKFSDLIFMFQKELVKNIIKVPIIKLRKTFYFN